MKKIITIIIVLVVIFAATYFIQQNMMKSDVMPSDTETQDVVATTTGEAVSSIPSIQPKELNFNFTQKVGPISSYCLNKTYTPTIINGTNNIAPYPYPVELSFVGTVDDNLQINGKIVDADKGLQPGSPCSHRHSLSYKTTIPANTPIKIEVVDQHGGDVSLIGKLTITPVQTNRKAKVNVVVKINGQRLTGTIPVSMVHGLNPNTRIALNTISYDEKNRINLFGASFEVNEGSWRNSRNYLDFSYQIQGYKVTSNNCDSTLNNDKIFRCALFKTQGDRTINLTVNK